MDANEELEFALCLYDCLTVEERCQILDLLKALSSDQESADDSQDQEQKTT